jgi:predicted nucleic acid-binding protein
MAGWLLDASVLLAANDAGDPNHADAVRLLMAPQPVLTLDLAGYETTNVAIRAWRDPAAARTLATMIDAIDEAGGLVRVERRLLVDALELADSRGLSAYDAAYVAASRSAGAQLVSCDVKDLVSVGFARLPRDAMT